MLWLCALGGGGLTLRTLARSEQLQQLAGQSVTMPEKEEGLPAIPRRRQQVLLICSPYASSQDTFS